MKIKAKLITLTVAIVSSLSSPAVEKLIIVNEGNWQCDNGKLSYFEDGKMVTNQWFRDVNGTKLGDTPNDIIQINNNLIAIAINWSNIVQFITPDGKAVAAIENIPNNRKLASDGKYLYVTSYGHECSTNHGMDYFTKGYVAKIDVSTFQVIATCEVGYEPEGIALYNGHLFIANTGGYAFQENHPYETTVSIVDAATMTKVRDVDTGQINLYGKVSKSGKYLCINSPGDYYNIMAATVIFDCDAALKGEEDCFVKLDYASTYNCTATDGNFYAVGSRYSYITGEYTFNYLTIDPRRVMETKGAEGISAKLPGTVEADIKKMAMPYGMYVNPYTGYIYATDAASYASAGALYQWSPTGVFIAKYKLYINPGHFLALSPNGTFDGISSVAAEGSNDTYYNLLGIPVAHPVSNHIYIHNGRKVLYR